MPSEEYIIARYIAGPVDGAISAPQNPEPSRAPAKTGDFTAAAPEQKAAGSTGAQTGSGPQKAKPSKASNAVAGSKAVFLTHTDTILRMKSHVTEESRVKVQGRYNQL